MLLQYNPIEKIENLIAIERKRGYVKDKCVCVCVCVRERERERDCAERLRSLIKLDKNAYSS